MSWPSSYTCLRRASRCVEPAFETAQTRKAPHVNKENNADRNVSSVQFGCNMREESSRPRALLLPKRTSSRLTSRSSGWAERLLQHSHKVVPTQVFHSLSVSFFVDDLSCFGITRLPRVEQSPFRQNSICFRLQALHSPFIVVSGLIGRDRFTPAQVQHDVQIQNSNRLLVGVFRPIVRVLT
jgi:hypothetical protein